MNNMNIVAGEPFTLPDGTQILPQPNDNGQKIVSPEQQEVEQEIDDELEAIATEGRGEFYQRTLADITVSQKRMNTIMVICGYTVWGLSDYAISQALNVSIEAIEAVKDSEQFAETMQQFVESIRYAETSSIHGYLSEKARHAAVTVATELRSRDGDRRLKAAQDILDRTGFRPADRVEHVHKFDDDLRIVRVTEKEIPTIDVGAD